MPKLSRTKKSIKFRTKSPIKTYKGRRDKFMKRHSEQRATLHKKYRTHKSPIRKSPISKSPIRKSSMRKSRYSRRKVSKSTRPRISINLSKNTHYEYNKKKPPRTLEYLDKMIIA